MIESKTADQVPLVTVDSLYELKRLRRAGVEAVIWDRSLPRGLDEWLERVSPECWPTARYVLPSEKTEDCLERLFDTTGVPRSPQRAWLIRDISSLGSAISAMFETPYIRLRVEAVTGDACRRFHVDTVLARMVCTYVGPGTQYGVADDEHVPEGIQHLPLCIPMLFKGLLWDGPHAKRLRHRSPPISGTGITRFVVVLEPVLDVAEEISAYDSEFAG